MRLVSCEQHDERIAGFAHSDIGVLRLAELRARVSVSKKAVVGLGSGSRVESVALPPHRHLVISQARALRRVAAFGVVGPGHARRFLIECPHARHAAESTVEAQGWSRRRCFAARAGRAACDPALLKQRQELLFGGTVRLTRGARWIAKLGLGKLGDDAGAVDTTLPLGAGPWLA